MNFRVKNPNMRMKLYREDEDPDEDKPYENISNEIERPVQREMDMHGELLLSEPIFPTINGPSKVKTIVTKRDQDGHLTGNYNPIPMVNTRVYIAKFHDGSTKEYATNVIAEAVYDQVTDDGCE
jgi:hypothetical protein